MTIKNKILLVFILFGLSSFGQVRMNASDLKRIEAKSSTKIIAVCKPKDFAQGHVQNSVNVWRPDYEDHNARFEGLMASKDTMAALLGRLGITQNDVIVIYDLEGGCEAARFWWILDFYNYKKAHILEGGIDHWRSKKIKFTTEPTLIESKSFVFQGENDSSLYADLDDVRSAKKRGAILFDVRTKEEFTGDLLKDGASRAGRIPNAIFGPWTNAINFNGDLMLKSVKDLKKHFESKGLSKNQEIIVYCHSGVRSAHTTFVLSKILGYSNVKNYDGAWIEYSNHKELPIKTGEEVVKPKSETKNMLPVVVALLLGLPLGLFMISRIQPKWKK